MAVHRLGVPAPGQGAGSSASLALVSAMQMPSGKPRVDFRDLQQG